MEDKGIQTEIGNYNREIKAHNTSVKSLKEPDRFTGSVVCQCQGKAVPSVRQGRKISPALQAPQYLRKHPQASPSGFGAIRINRKARFST
jgi:hypothetical protein